MLIALASNIRMFQSRGSAPSWPTTRTTRSCSRRLLLLTTNSSIDKRAPDLAQSGKKKWRKHLQLTKTPIHPTTHLYKIPGPTDGSVPPPSFPSAAAAAAAAVIISAGGTAVARADGRTDGRTDEERELAPIPRKRPKSRRARLMRWAEEEEKEKGGREGRRERPIMRRLTRPIDGSVGEWPTRKEEDFFTEKGQWNKVCVTVHVDSGL